MGSGALTGMRRMMGAGASSWVGIGGRGGGGGGCFGKKLAKDSKVKRAIAFFKSLPSAQLLRRFFTLRLDPMVVAFWGSRVTDRYSRAH